MVGLWILSLQWLLPNHRLGSGIGSIEAVIKKFNKRSFCRNRMLSSRGSSKIPNDWTLHGAVDLDEQLSGIGRCLKNLKEAGYPVMDFGIGLGTCIIRRC